MGVEVGDVERQGCVERGVQIIGKLSTCMTPIRTMCNDVWLALGLSRGRRSMSARPRGALQPRRGGGRRSPCRGWRCKFQLRPPWSLNSLAGTVRLRPRPACARCAGSCHRGGSSCPGVPATALFWSSARLVPRGHAVCEPRAGPSLGPGLIGLRRRIFRAAGGGSPGSRVRVAGQEPVAFSG